LQFKRKVINSLTRPTLSRVAKHYVALQYIEEDEEEPITFFQHPNKTMRRTFQVPAIPFGGTNLVATLSHVEILPMEKKHVHEQAYLLIEAMQKRGAYHNEIQKDEEVQEMVTSQSNSQDQHSIEIFPDTSMVDASHEKIIVEIDDFKVENI
jgi:hypothetical protein